MKAPIYAAWIAHDRFGRHVRCVTRCHAPDMELYRLNAQARKGFTIIGKPCPAPRREN